MAARRAPLVPWRVAKARFLLRPWWLLSHVLVMLLVVTMVSLGFWQLRRLDEKRDRNALIESRMEQPVEPVGRPPGPGDAEVRSAARFRQVTAAGTYDDDATVVVRNRSQDGGGRCLARHAARAGGRVDQVGVLRGFVGSAADGAAVRRPRPRAR